MNAWKSKMMVFERREDVINFIIPCRMSVLAVGN